MECSKKQSNRVRFMYFRDQKRNPRACLAYQIDWDKQVMYWGISILNPEDRFNRNLSRKIAEGRLTKRPCPFTFEAGDRRTVRVLHDFCKALPDATFLRPQYLRKFRQHFLLLVESKMDYFESIISDPESFYEQFHLFFKMSEKPTP